LREKGNVKETFTVVIISILCLSMFAVLRPTFADSPPVISSVTPIAATQLQTIKINGSGFDNTQPQTYDVGDNSVDTINSSTTPYMWISDAGKMQKTGNSSNGGENWNAGLSGDSIGVFLENWSDTQIVLGGFGTYLGTNYQGQWYIEPGDPLTINVVTPSGQANYSLVVTTPVHANGVVVYHYDCKWQLVTFGYLGQFMNVDSPTLNTHDVSPGPYPYQFNLNGQLHVFLRIRHFLWSNNNMTDNHLSIFVDGKLVFEADGRGSNWYPGGNGINLIDLGTLSAGTHYVTMTESEGGYYDVNWWEILSNVLAITNVTLSKTVVGWGYGEKVSVRATNLENYTETFNITAYVNAATIATQTVTLTSGNSTTSSFTWNTTGFAYGNYTIRANVTLPLGETNNLTGPFISGEIKVTIPGDCNGDGSINVLDLILIAGHLGHNATDYAPYSPDWHTFNNCDLNSDGTINVLDMILCASHLGQY